MENDIPELKFVYSGAQFDTKVLLTYKNGVADTFLNYGKILNEPDILLPFKFDNSQLEDKFFEQYWEYEFVIFHIWFSSLWQYLGLYECGLKVNISDGQCSSFFYLNDFNWKDDSKTKDNNNYPIKRLTEKDLTPLQIFENLKRNRSIFR